MGYEPQADFGTPAVCSDTQVTLTIDGREVVTLNVDALGEVGGGIHCATHEVPSP